MTAALFPKSIAVTSVPVRKTTPYLACSSARERHSSFEASVTSALLSFVLVDHGVSTITPEMTSDMLPVDWCVVFFGEDSDHTVVAVLRNNPAQ